MSEKLSVAVLGGGNGAFITAADLKLKNHNVNLCEHPNLNENIKGALKKGGIDLKVVGRPGMKPGFAKLDNITTDFAEAVAGVEVVLIIVPAFAQKYFAEACAPFLEDGQTVVLSPGNFGGALQFRQIYKEKGNDKNLLVGETECMIYSGFKENSSAANVSGYKKGLRIAAFPGNDTKKVFDKVKKLYPEIKPANTVLETGLRNINTVVHAPITILNTGWIEKTGGDFLFYWDGCTPSVGSLIEKIDDERLEIGKTLGIKLTPMAELSLEWYAHEGAKGDNLQEILSTNPVYKIDFAPKTLNHRFLTEDIPYGMVPMESLGQLAGIPTPNTSAVIEIASALLDRDLRKEARDLKSFNLNNLSLDELERFVKEGN
jgi:opine dehydrogenase